MAMTAFELLGVLKLDDSEFQSSLTKTTASAATALGGGLATAAKVGLVAVGAATSAMVGFGATAVGVGSQFDTAMGGVAATMGQTVDELEAEVGTVNTSFGEFSGTLREFAMFMGQNTKFSASEAAAALNYMALAGYNTQQSMEMLPSVLDMAAAGAMDLAQASDMITDTQRALNMSFERTSQMVDEFAKAASTGNTSVEQLGEAFLRVGGLAKELNGGMIQLSDGTVATVDGVQELEIAFTAMANAGVKGNEAGTHMRNMLLKLSSPTKDGTAALEAMGVAIFDTEGKMRSLSEIFGDLNAAFETMTQEERIGVISDLFNTRDMASAEALLGAIGQDWDHIGESILQAEGAAAQMSATKLDNLAGDITIFRSALETAQIVINDQLSPTLREFVQFGTQGIATLTQAFQEGGLTGAMESFGTVLADGLNMVIEKLPEMVNAGVQLLGALGQGLIDNLPIIIDAANQIMDTLGNALLAMAPVLKENIPDIMKQLTEGIMEHVDTIIEVGIVIMGAIAEGVVKSIPVIISKIPEILGAIAKGFIENPEALLVIVPNLLTSLGASLIANKGILFNALRLIVLDVLPAITPAIATVISGVGTFISTSLIPMLANVGTVITSVIIPGLASLVSAIAPVIAAAAPFIAIAAAIVAAGVLIYKNWDTIKEKALELRDAILERWESIKETFETVKTAIVDIWNNIVDAAKQWGGDMMDNFISGVKEKFSSLIDTVRDVASTVKNYLGFSEPDMGPLSNFHTFAPDMMRLFAEGITDNQWMITDAISDAFDLSGQVNTVETQRPSNYSGMDSGYIQQQRVAVDVNFTGSLSELARLLKPYITAETTRVGPSLAIVGGTHANY